MYVTQTYLGLIATHAKRYVYLLSEGYRGENQADFYREIKNRIGEIGLSSGAETAVLVSSPGSEEKILDEIRSGASEAHQRFYQKNIYGRTPGVLITRVNLSDPESLDGAVYVSFADVKYSFGTMRATLSAFSEAAESEEGRNWLDRLNGFVELKPNFLGFGLNLNAMIEAFRSARNR